LVSRSRTFPLGPCLTLWQSDTKRRASTVRLPQKCRRLAQLARLDLLVLDDLAIAPIAAQERQDLLELLDDRVGSRSTLITSQMPSSAWHQWLGEPTIADAIMAGPADARLAQHRAQGRVAAPGLIPGMTQHAVPR